MLNTFAARQHDTIIAQATASGPGAIAVIRLSGPAAITLTNEVFPAKDLAAQPSHTLHFGTIREQERVLDEVVVALFRAPHSYTREDVVEISCHGSDFIIQQLIGLFLQKGARLAQPGEFTRRAFLHGRFDLAQAEAVADLIAADSAAAHEMALKQMRGGFSDQIRELRAQLIHFASLIELELDFSEEDVEFADRTALRDLVLQIQAAIEPLLASFAVGNVLKTGVPTLIIGKPNAGKSTLLNALLNEERAIVSDIPGTTRDFIEDEVNLEGIRFRFIDTAGLRETTDQIERLGVDRTLKKVEKSSVLLYLFDLSATTPAALKEEVAPFRDLGIPLLLLGNKQDRLSAEELATWKQQKEVLLLSAATGEGMAALREQLLQTVRGTAAIGTGVVISNLRHYESLQQTHQALTAVLEGLAMGITQDFIAADIRRALHFLGLITGEITTNDLLDNIFSKFCIGK